MTMYQTFSWYFPYICIVYIFSDGLKIQSACKQMEKNAVVIINACKDKEKKKTQSTYVVKNRGYLTPS